MVVFYDSRMFIYRYIYLPLHQNWKFLFSNRPLENLINDHVDDDNNDYDGDDDEGDDDNEGDDYNDNDGDDNNDDDDKNDDDNLLIILDLKVFKGITWSNTFKKGFSHPYYEFLAGLTRFFEHTADFYKS
jgi:hypothetical protein